MHVHPHDAPAVAGIATARALTLGAFRHEEGLDAGHVFVLETNSPLETGWTLDHGKDCPYHGTNPPYLVFDTLAMITSKLTSKAQTTIPQPVRAALQLKEGDALHYEIVDGRVILTKARSPAQADDPFRTFHEWNSEADERAYGNL